VANTFIFASFEYLELLDLDRVTPVVRQVGVAEGHARIGGTPLGPQEVQRDEPGRVGLQSQGE